MQHRVQVQAITDVACRARLDFEHAVWAHDKLGFVSNLDAHLANGHRAEPCLIRIWGEAQVTA
jgi:hypothetical protein